MFCHCGPKSNQWTWTGTERNNWSQTEPHQPPVGRDCRGFGSMDLRGAFEIPVCQLDMWRYFDHSVDTIEWSVSRDTVPTLMMTSSLANIQSWIKSTTWQAPELLLTHCHRRTWRETERNTYIHQQKESTVVVIISGILDHWTGMAKIAFYSILFSQAKKEHTVSLTYMARRNWEIEIQVFQISVPTTS